MVRSFATRVDASTHKVEYPDIQDTCKRIGAAPTTTKSDGTPLYTLPMIYDPNTGIALSDSFLIAEYLDKTYPDTPRVIPPRTRALQAAFIVALESKLGALFQFLMPKATWALNKASEAHFRKEGLEMKAEAEFGAINTLLTKEDEFVMGDTLSFADFALGAILVTSKVLLGEDSEEWKRIANWHEGRWGKLSQSLEKYAKV
ncbi:hypothetical protein VNI00_000514 [Paramarasmius palmivorus]|uniref:GST N-terminal domain-containing protein n=1 Tax=Paramarasmius palmivorus TaxID=297713 RepID=A0AAW0E926_9AGAR